MKLPEKFYLILTRVSKTWMEQNFSSLMFENIKGQRGQ
jgi:hypothetical protein